MLPPAFAAELTAPPATPPALAAVFVTAPTAPPAADVTPPSAPRQACVTRPTTIAPLGITVLPSDFTASVVRALTASPGLHSLESTRELSAALNAVPAASELFTFPSCADAEVDTDALPDA